MNTDGAGRENGGVSSRVQNGIERVLREPPTMEHVLLLLFLGVGTYMYLGADEFAEAAAVFPRVLSAATIVLSAALLVRNYLPGPLRRVVAEPMQLAGEEDLTGDIPDDEEAAGTYSYDIDDPRGPAVVGVLCVGYMLLTFSIGMLYSTPVFVAAYALWAGMERKRLVALTLLSFIVAYLFFAVISPDIAEGWLTGWELPVPELLVGTPIDAVGTLIDAVATTIDTGGETIEHTGESG